MENIDSSKMLLLFSMALVFFLVVFNVIVWLLTIYHNPTCIAAGFDMAVVVDIIRVSCQTTTIINVPLEDVLMGGR